MINLFWVVVCTMCATVSYNDGDKVGLAVSMIAASLNFAYVAAHLDVL